MIKKTKGIVISYIKYGETSIIVRIFTRELGQKSYIVNGVRTSKSNPKMAIYQPLSLLDLIVYDRDSSSLNRISESKLYIPFRKIPFDFYRSGIAIFIGEVLGKSIHEGYQNAGLYDFLERSIEYLDQSEEKLGLFPITFLLELSGFLGFSSATAEELYEQLPPEKNKVLILEKEHLLNQLIQFPLKMEINTGATVKRALLDDLIRFFQIHLDNFSEIKSVRVLRELGT